MALESLKQDYTKNTKLLKKKNNNKKTVKVIAPTLFVVDVSISYHQGAWEVFELRVAWTLNWGVDILPLA